MTTDKTKIEYKLNKQIYIKLLYYLQQRAAGRLRVFRAETADSRAGMALA